MGSDLVDPVLHDDSEPGEDASDGCHPNKKKRGKVPKRVLKAEREKLKREQLNEHFSRLASVLELSEQNNGKASILNETIRLVNDTVSQIQTLRKENANLLSESHYMTTEKDELKDETSALEAQIKKMQSELDERLAQSKPDLNLTPLEYWQTEMASHFMEGCLSQLPTADPTSTPQPPILGPLYVIPVGPDLQTFQKADTTTDPHPVAVSKPHARYPAPTDSWPLHLLSKQPEATS